MEKKLYPCSECGRMVPIRSKGLCPSCRNRQHPLKKGAPIVSRKKAKPQPLRDLFSRHVEFLNTNGGLSMESGRSLLPATSCNVCHILPKRTYKSVADNDLNIIYLTLDEHQRFDGLLDCLEFDKIQMEFPRVWKIVLQRVNMMLAKNLISERGKLLNALEEWMKK